MTDLIFIPIYIFLLREASKALEKAGVVPLFSLFCLLALCAVVVCVLVVVVVCASDIVVYSAIFISLVHSD